MNVHIALYKWNKNISEDEIDQALAEVGALAEKVPGIIEICTAKNTSKFSEGYTHVILVRAESQSAVDAYRAHPDHASIAQRIELMEEQGIGVDFETKRSSP